MLHKLHSIIRVARQNIWRFDSIWEGKERKYCWMYKRLLRISPRILFKSEDGRIVIRDQIEDGRPVRRLECGNIGQSSLFLDKNGDRDPVFAYMQTLKDIIREHQDIERILLIGGGGFVFPRYFLNIVPHGKITVVEIDAKLYEIARKYFFLGDDPRIQVVIQDGLSYISKTVAPNVHIGDGVQSGNFDMVIFDVFDGPNPVPAFHTESAYALVKMILKPHGLFAINMLNEKKHVIPSHSLSSHTILAHLFKNANILQCPNGWNHILFASKT